MHFCHSSLSLSLLVTLLKASFDTADDRFIGRNATLPSSSERTSYPANHAITLVGERKRIGRRRRAGMPASKPDPADLMDHLASHFATDGIAWKGNKTSARHIPSFLLYQWGLLTHPALAGRLLIITFIYYCQKIVCAVQFFPNSEKSYL